MLQIFERDAQSKAVSISAHGHLVTRVFHRDTICKHFSNLLHEKAIFLEICAVELEQCPEWNLLSRLSSDDFDWLEITRSLQQGRFTWGSHVMQVNDLGARVSTFSCLGGHCIAGSRCIEARRRWSPSKEAAVSCTLLRGLSSFIVVGRSHISFGLADDWRMSFNALVRQVLIAIDLSVPIDIKAKFQVLRRSSCLQFIGIDILGCVDLAPLVFFFRDLHHILTSRI